MHVSIPRKALTDALRVLKHGAKKRPGMSILESVLVTADDSGIVLRTHCIDLAIRVKVPGEVHLPGVALVSFPTLGKLTKAGDGKDIQVRAESSTTIRVDSTRLEYQHDPADAPALPEALDVAPTFRVPADVLSHALAACLPFTSDDPTRYRLAGVYLADSGDVVATDAYRLHRVETGHPLTDLGSGFIVDRLCVASILDTIKTYAPDSVALRTALVDEKISRIEIEAGPVTIQARGIDGQFPDYLQVIPNRAPRCAFAVEGQALDKAVAYVTTLSAHMVQILASPGRVYVGMAHPEDGIEALKDLPVTTLKHDPRTAQKILKEEGQQGREAVKNNLLDDVVTLDPAYLRQALKVLGLKTSVTVAMHGVDGSPCVLVRGNETHVLMPKRGISTRVVPVL